MYLMFPLRGFSLESGNSGRPQENRMTGLPGRERSLTISLAVWIQYTNVTDRLTDRHKPTAKTALTHSA